MSVVFFITIFHEHVVSNPEDHCLKKGREGDRTDTEI